MAILMGVIIIIIIIIIIIHADTLAGQMPLRVTFKEHHEG